MSERLFELVDGLKDPALFGAALGPYGTWATWFACLNAAYGVALSPDELKAFKEVAGNREPPSSPVREFWAIVGRRSGKSRVAGGVSSYAGVLAAESPDNGLSRGERGWVLN